ncbi:MAG TPA: hypothetical protein DDW52_04830 [Planctomycetaceae bacterium]|nr:hypothetical protein [Planctomycetaceae bacterium]
MQSMLSTSDFASALGISESSVRRLADSGLLEIHRTQGGHRRIPVAEAVRYVRETGAAVTRPELLGIVDTKEAASKRDFSDLLHNALAEGSAIESFTLMQAMREAGYSIAQLCDGPIRDAMLAIGSRWPSDKRSIFIEHRATIICVQSLCQIRMSIPNPSKNAPSALGAAPQDDPYLLPSLMVSLVLHDCGYAETNLGPNTPVDVLTDAVEDEQPDLVWLALNNPVRSRQLTREIDDLAKTVQRYRGKLFIGGKNADSYENPIVERCATMADLNRKALSLAAA